MKEYEWKLRAVWSYCLEREWSVVDLHMLFSRIYNVVHYHRLWANADTPEATKLAAWSHEEAYQDLLGFINARCFPDDVRRAVLWLAENTP